MEEKLWTFDKICDLMECWSLAWIRLPAFSHKNVHLEGGSQLKTLKTSFWFRSNHFLEKFKYMNSEYADDEEKCENIRLTRHAQIKYFDDEEKCEGKKSWCWEEVGGGEY